MTSRVSKLVLAAVLAASIPAVAAARDCDHHGAPAAHGGPAHHPAPAPGARWREASWRDRELLHVRAELRALERERAEYHARHAGHPGKLRKYDRAHAARRAELERRWHELRPMVAWR
jgi:hypothetical protein